MHEKNILIIRKGNHFWINQTIEPSNINQQPWFLDNYYFLFIYFYNLHIGFCIQISISANYNTDRSKVCRILRRLDTQGITRQILNKIFSHNLYY